MVKGIIISLLVFLLFGLSLKSGLAFEQKTYSLQITLNASCLPFLNYQSVSSVDVSFQLENIGNETFNGTVTLEAKTDKGHSWNVLTYSVENLNPNETYSNSTSYPSMDEGLYYFTVNIQSNDTLSSIKLYQGSNMIDEGSRVQTSTSILLHSYTEFIEIMAILVPIIVVIVGAIVGFAVHRKRKKH